VLSQIIWDWVRADEVHDQAAIQEWLEEARNADATLADLVADYTKTARHYLQLLRTLQTLRTEREAQPGNDDNAWEAKLFLRSRVVRERVAIKREEIWQHLRSLGEPVTKMYPGQLPLFPLVYRLEVHFDELGKEGEELSDGETSSFHEPVIWDSGLDVQPRQHRSAEISLRSGRDGNLGMGRVRMNYQLHAWNKRQRNEEVKARRLWQLGLLAVAASGLGLAWLLLLQADEREHYRQRLLARERIDLAERQRLEEERRRVETERELLEQRLATQAAEQKALELKSHLYASIGIMAGSYAHNIKNLLVRPNDLLRRCLERAEAGPEQDRMLREVQQTLGLVTDRLQQILQTVRRDPSRSELRLLDLNLMAQGVKRTWGELAADRWQVDLELDLTEGALWIKADDSHLHQAIENLLFNARDATFEMRNHLREQARHKEGLDGPGRRQALIAAAAWRGKVIVRTRRKPGEVLLEISDNGAGMTDEVRQRCTETHFSTKRDNALHQGNSTGMGLGLSFVAAILQNHQADLEIESLPLHGSTFRVRFEAASESI
jgi:signal transduction histidine kinase